MRNSTKWERVYVQGEAKKDRYNERAHMFRQGGAEVAADKPGRKSQDEDGINSTDWRRAAEVVEPLW